MKRGAIIAYEVIFVILSCTIVSVSGILAGITHGEMIRNAIISVFAGIAILFSYEREKEDGQLMTKTDRTRPIFLLLTIVFLIFSCCFTLLSPTAWIFPVLITALTIYSGTITGITTGTYLILVAVSLSDAPLGIFFLYFIVGIFAAVLFHKLDDRFRIALPIVGALSVHAVSLIAQVVFFISGVTQMESFLMPAINLIMNAILYFILMKIYSASVTHRYREIYQTINDQEYEWMLQLKDNNPDAYYHAVHTAYFAERIADLLHADKLLSKGGSYYLDIDEHDDLSFPPPLRVLLSELQSQDIYSKEAAIVYISGTVISNVSKQLHDRPNLDLNYNNIIEDAFEQIYKDGVLNQVCVTFQELHQMKKFFIKEQIYFDFLR